MAANTSARRLQIEILASPAATYAACFLAVDCAGDGCDRGRTFPMAGLAGVIPGATVADIVKRMRCRACGGPLVSARLQAGASRGKATRWIDLIGTAVQGPRRD